METAKNICYNWGPNLDDKLAATGKFLISGGLTAGLAYLSGWHLTAAGVSTVAIGLATGHFLLYSNRTADSKEDKKIGYDNAWRLNGKFSMLSIVMGQAAANVVIVGLALKTSAVSGNLFKGFLSGQRTMTALNLGVLNVAFLGGVLYLCSRDRFQPRLGSDSTT